MRRTLDIITFVAALRFVQPAFADAIDGDWCRTDGKRMTIRGPAIVTPGGQQTNGHYTRHSFSYVIPAGEAGRGPRCQSNCSANISRMRARGLMPRFMSGAGVSLG